MADSNLDRGERVAAYKGLLRKIIDRNPSGLRLRLAKELNTHKSFISQISNPLDQTPIPAKHVPSLFKLCHFSANEEETFMILFRGAHPRRATKINTDETSNTKTIEIEIPILNDSGKQKKIESLIVDTINRIIEITKL